ncbi:glycosyltransferase [Loktanella sp. SALINAS62]|uniref:glycosyltransferase n=1 Tax=Loktanella sp. SALINAS62 TaxID=2706124 RepID=UPI001B8C4B2B|nr:glycosyltransferase [Loktanella sp. SALINAS62]MBS1301792.1 glycosyltransferase family 4 protein [Loktanella sp. SALINAS62]
MKILIYNWAKFDSPVMAGGGVTMYLRNVIRELLARDNVEVWFLSSGNSYRFWNRKPCIEETANAFDHPRLRTFTLVNSPIKAPAHAAFNDIDQWLRDEVTPRLVYNFIDLHGPFDALHIHNLEGIGADVLNLPKGDKLRRIFYTFHNYMPVCPQIELLYDNRLTCNDYNDGNSCVGCLASDHRMADLIAIDRIGGAIKRQGLAGHPLGGFLFDMFVGTKSYIKAARNLTHDLIGGLRTGFRDWGLRARSEAGKSHDWKAGPKTRVLLAFPPAARLQEASAYRQWREANGLALRDHVDGIFAVSDLCRQTAMRFLPPGTKVETLLLPIDIEVPTTERQALRANRPIALVIPGEAPPSPGLTLSFIGYDIVSKGLPFLIDALTAIDDTLYRETVDLLIVARLSPRLERQLAQLETRFRSVRVVPGYERDQLSALSQMIDLNIVPSIWWETFNQVMVELARLGVPSLVSSHVGAKQTLTRPENFVFEAGDPQDFRNQLDRLLRNAELRDSFFDENLQMPSLIQHVDQLVARYCGHATASSSPSNLGTGTLQLRG